ncbi:hypothetical protein PoB_006551700 [Plakobranchus ocellatus]|uniref:Secreted protein n=1 Tax=Plakobranchus ocellatus TaxID=259542 RepID=A0AAV4D4D5_9GAST|nr:hypothetical protein PoB_006551700 [Plakobranchus ocellatus]
MRWLITASIYHLLNFLHSTLPRPRYTNKPGLATPQSSSIFRVAKTRDRGLRGVGGRVTCESALRFAGTLLSRVGAPPSPRRPNGGPKSLRSPCCRFKPRHRRPGLTEGLKA